MAVDISEALSVRVHDLEAAAPCNYVLTFVRTRSTSRSRHSVRISCTLRVAGGANGKRLGWWAATTKLKCLAERWGRQAQADCAADDQRNT
jgi:hypothetical protein